LYVRSKISLISWPILAQTVGPFLLLAFVTVWTVVHFARSAPPHTLTISAGPKGSTFAAHAQRYSKILARNGITLKVVESEGSLDNLHRLLNRNSHVDIALVQSGLPHDEDADKLVSLGGMFYQPLSIFYRSPKPLARLSELSSRRIAIGPEGSGTRYLALALLKANEIGPQGATQLLGTEGEAARSALLHGQADVIFLTGDSAAPATINEMMHAEGVRLFDFVQADAYIRRFPYLNKLVVPAGAFDLGENLPPTEINLLAPTVELLAHSDLHPALIDLLIEAAIEVHGQASLLHAASVFPSAVMHTFPLADEAARYYKSGDKSFMYRHLPFWVASLVDRAIVLLVPIIVIVVPGLKYVPQLYRWRIDRRIHRRYGELMAVEREALGDLTEERRCALLNRVGEIERAIIARKIPGSHAEQAYTLRQHLEFVRDALARVRRPQSVAVDQSGH
jgi:TRAP-type uncharacterized transport system substrate-binding protein